jgi:hypothetical protein
MFENLETASPDAIYAIMAAVRADPRPHKIDLSIGVYHDRERRSPIMAAVRRYRLSCGVGGYHLRHPGTAIHPHGRCQSSV